MVRIASLPLPHPTFANFTNQNSDYSLESYQIPHPSPPIYTLVSLSPHTRPPSPSHVISEIDGSPLLPFSSTSPAPTNNAFFPPSRGYCPELPSPETDARAEMEGDSPAKSMKSARSRCEPGEGKPAIRRNDEAAQLGEGGQSFNFKIEGQGDREGNGLEKQNHHQ